MRQISTILASLVLTFLAALPIQAQTETSAFYIYQNDGHFDGFFYDEVEKIRYSVLDTLGIEHDEVVSQEIVTADSTYRIMLSAIDSVGFVQPEIKYNPKLHQNLWKSGGDDTTRYFYSDESTDYWSVDFTFNAEELTITYDLMRRTPEIWPTKGDVFLFRGTERLLYEDGWAIKVESVEDKNYWIVLHCKPIDDITDIFQQFVSVEELGYRPNGELARRRVAARPDLNVGEFPRTASEGKWEGDIFNFSIAGHIPVYSKDDLSITIDPIIEGKLNVKTAWNMSWWGDKYISIASTLNFGVGMGFTVDGTIDTFFPGGIGGLNSGVPVPASCPLFMLDISPDAFLRGDAHVKFNAKSPMLNGAMWARLEINNWWPSMSIGFGKPAGEKFDAVDDSGSGWSLELSGFVQGGLWFPMKYRTLPILKSIFHSEIGGSWFVGPKLAGSISLDTSTLATSDTATYNLLKNTKLSLHMLDADYEVKAKMQTFLSGVQEVTLTDGSISVFPPLDAALAPEFGDIEMEMEERKITQKYVLDQTGRWSSDWEPLEGTTVPCRTFYIPPSGAVIKPVTIAAALFHVEKDGTETMVSSPQQSLSYYHLHMLLGKELPKSMNARYDHLLVGENFNYSGIYRRDQYFPEDESIIVLTTDAPKLRIRPIVKEFGQSFIANPYIEFQDVPVITLGKGSIVATYDGTTKETVQVRTDGTPKDTMTSISQGKVSLVKTVFNKIYGKNYSLINTVVDTLETIAEHRYDNIIFRAYGRVPVEIQPNTSENPIVEGYTYSVSRLSNGKGWHFSVNTQTPDSNVEKVSFDIEEIPSEDHSLASLREKQYEAKGFILHSRNSNGSISNHTIDQVNSMYLDSKTGYFSPVDVDVYRFSVHFKDNFDK